MPTTAVNTQALSNAPIQPATPHTAATHEPIYRLNWLHYLFLAVILVSVNAFQLSVTRGGYYVTDHLFVKNLYSVMLLMPLTIVAIIWSLWQTKRLSFANDAITLWVIGWLLYGSLSLWWADYKGFAVTKLTIWWVGLVTYFWAYSLLRNGGLLPLIKTLFLAGCLVALFGLWQVYFEPNPAKFAQMKFAGLQPKRIVDMLGAPSSTFGNRNMAIHVVILSVPLAFYLIATTATRAWKGLYFIGLAALLLFAYHSQSRSAYLVLTVQLLLLSIFFMPTSLRRLAYGIALALSAAALYVLHFSLLGWVLAFTVALIFSVLHWLPKLTAPRLRWRQKTTTYSILTVVSLLILSNHNYELGKIAPFWEVPFGRLETTMSQLAEPTPSAPNADATASTTPTQTSSTQTTTVLTYHDVGNVSNADLRLHVWRDALTIFRTYPILGVGLGNFYPTFHFGAFDVHIASAVRYPHNEYLTILVELGVIGFAAMLILFGLLLRAIWRIYSSLIHVGTDEELSEHRSDAFLLLICVTVAGIGTLINSAFSFPYEYVTPYLFAASLLAIIAHLKRQICAPKITQPTASSSTALSDDHCRSYRDGVIGMIVILVSATNIGLYGYWQHRFAHMDWCFKQKTWQPISFHDSRWLTHANYFWTIPTYLSTFKQAGYCDAAYSIADSILKVAPAYYFARFERSYCGAVTDIDATLKYLSAADLVSTYQKDNAWDNLLRLAVEHQQPSPVKAHLDAMEAAYLHRPALVQHRYANSLGRRFYQFAIIISPEARAYHLTKAAHYLSLAAQAKPTNTKYKVDLLRVYQAQNDTVKAQSVVDHIHQFNP